MYIEINHIIYQVIQLPLTSLSPIGYALVMNISDSNWRLRKNFGLHMRKCYY